MSKVVVVAWLGGLVRMPIFLFFFFFSLPSLPFSSLLFRRGAQVRVLSGRGRTNSIWIHVAISANWAADQPRILGEGRWIFTGGGGRQEEIHSGGRERIRTPTQLPNYHCECIIITIRRYFVSGRRYHVGRNPVQGGAAWACNAKYPFSHSLPPAHLPSPPSFLSSLSLPTPYPPP